MRLLLIVSFLFSILLPRLGAQGAADETARLARIATIAAELQRDDVDGAALFTEATRLAGFTIRSEERALLAEPLGAPLHLALTDAEIRGYVELHRAGHTVQLADLLAAFDLLWRGMGVDAATAPIVDEWRQQVFRTGAPATRGLATLLQALGSQRGDEGCIDRIGDVELDPLQALLLVRVVSEDLLLPLRSVLQDQATELGREVPKGPSEPLLPLPLDGPGWAEDGFVGSITGLVGKGLEHLDAISKTAGEWAKVVGGADKLAKGLGYANAIAAVAKCIATYTFLKGEVRLDEPGQPLVRTKRGPAQSDAGETRTLVARFWIDGTKVTDWMKEHRPLVALAGLDIDMPKSGALGGIETEWDIREDRHSSKNHLVQLADRVDISKVRTDENGEARIRLAGRPQPVDISREACLPVEKKVPIVVTPQVKSTQMQQDLVDAVLGAVGIAGGPEGWIGPVVECLYRMKWKGGHRFTLQVRDWVPADVIATVEITIKASGADFQRDHGVQATVDRSLAFRGVRMMGMEIDMPPIDEALLRMLPQAVREQMLEGRRQLEKLAQEPTFQSEPHGTAELHVHDRESRYGQLGECDSKPFDAATTWTADLVVDLADTSDPSASLRMFHIQCDLPKKQAKLQVHLIALGKVRSQMRVGGKSTTKEYDEELGIWTGLRRLPPFAGDLVLPLQEVPNVVTGGVDYYGVASVPFRFGPDDRFSGTAFVSYTISRRPKGEKR